MVPVTLLPELTFDREAFLKTPRPYSADNGEVTSLYVIRSADYCKVGIANNVQRRLESFRAGNPHLLTLEKEHTFGSRLHALLCERTVHKVLAAYSVGREWFHVDASVAKNAASVVAAATRVWARGLALEDQRKQTEHARRMRDDPEYRARIEGQFEEMKKRWAKEIKASASMHDYRNALWDERRRLLSQDDPS